MRRGVIRVRSRCIAIDDSGRILVERAPDGTIELPGGRVEFNESIPFCLVREMMEEAGVTAEPRRLVYIVEFRGHRRGRWRHEVLFYFKCNLEGTPRGREGGLVFKWVSPEEIEDASFWPKPLLHYIRLDAPDFPILRFLVVEGDRLEYIMSGGLAPEASAEPRLMETT